ncbi:MAG: tRNA (adenosine(37)-N6)-dimethylallyltransferase MiaA [Candidatus Brocadiaceae bacterium]|nr:tRNA (adenosine(37)-N6)-dimethylallyltransferase MiaA [Candidatus Brocadiaceae bacterium]
MIIQPKPIPIWILTGPTASGKTEVALKIAAHCNAEIVSADSMLVYRGMDIGTQKPGHDIRKVIPHHFIDIVDPWEEYNVGRYIREFDTVARNLYQNGKPFIVVGGTALYIKAIVNGLFEGPSADWEYRKYLKSLAMEKESDYLHKMLADADPETAKKVHENDQKKIIRALEVLKLTGSSISSLQIQFGRKNPLYNCRIVAIQYDRDVMYKRIEDRVENMFRCGLLNEIKVLLNNPAGLGKQASQALGYKEVVDFFNQRYTLPEVVAIIKLRTRRFAKRQMTWFRSFSDVHWVHAHADDTVACLSEKVLKQFEK